MQAIPRKEYVFFLNLVHVISLISPCTRVEKHFRRSFLLVDGNRLPYPFLKRVFSARQEKYKCMRECSQKRLCKGVLPTSEISVSHKVMWHAVCVEQLEERSDRNVKGKEVLDKDSFKERFYVELGDQNTVCTCFNEDVKP